MATPKKKRLIDLMIEAGVKWPEGAEYAAQDKRFNKVNFYKNGKPNYPIGLDSWMADYCNYMRNDGLVLPSLCLNWHQTIVTREQYAEALATNVSEPAVDEVEWHNPPSIEHLTADYHAKAAEADHLQAVADEALKAADDALIALEKAGELLGLVIFIDTKPKRVDQQCSSAEWKIGDKCIVTSSPDDSDWVGRECVLIRIDPVDEHVPYKVVDKEEQEEFWVASIRRP